MNSEISKLDQNWNWTFVVLTSKLMTFEYLPMNIWYQFSFLLFGFHLDDTDMMSDFRHRNPRNVFLHGPQADLTTFQLFERHYDFYQLFSQLPDINLVVRLILLRTLSTFHIFPVL